MGDCAVGPSVLVDAAVGEVLPVALHLAEYALDVGDELLHVAALSSDLEIVNMLGQHHNQLRGADSVAAGHLMLDL